MKSLAVAAIVLAASTAHADPAAEETVAEAITSALGYVQGGAVTGFSPDGRIMAGITVDGGQRIHHDDGSPVSVWLHEGIIIGQSDELLNFSNMPKTGDLFGGRVGVDVRACTRREIACVIGGLDVAFQHDSYVEMMTRTTGFDAFAAPHLGLDFGTSLRLRPTIEVPVGQGIGLQAKLGLAYAW
jgi:hypothetical protein